VHKGNSKFHKFHYQRLIKDKPNKADIMQWNWWNVL